MKEDEFIQEHMNSKMVEDKILSITNEAFRIDVKDKTKFIDGKLTDLKSEIKKGKLDWTLTFPIYNLFIENPFSIGNVLFYNFDESRGLEFKELAQNFLKRDRR